MNLGSVLNQKQIKQDIDQLETIYSLSRVYAEIAAMRMKKIRGLVLASREFYRAVHEIFIEVLTSYIRQVKQIAHKRKGNITFLAHNGKTVAVLVSSEAGLYGDILQKTFALFMKEIEQQNIEVTIIGSYGAALFAKAMPHRPYTYFDFSETAFNQRKFAKIAAHLVQYEEIRLYYPKYENLVSQNPVVFSVSAHPNVSESDPQTQTKYLFEPSLKDILMFFESEIFTTVFEQAFRESQLAKLASRIMAMTQAGERIQDRIEKTQFEKLQLMHRINNQKQLNLFASRYLWK